MEFKLIIYFVVLMFLVSGPIMFLLHRVLVVSTEGAVNRLNQQSTELSAKQAELSAKIKQAEEELVRRRQEAQDLVNKMRAEAEEASKSEREMIIKKAREEGEEIITKAQNATVKLRRELEREIDSKIVDYGMDILNNILSDKAKGALDEILINEYLASLKNIDMSRIGPEVTTIDVFTLAPLSENTKKELASIIKQKSGRDLALKSSIDPKIGGGMVLKFSSMALDGSIKNLIREAGVNLRKQIESRA